MGKMISALWKLGMKRAEKEFWRYHETWNPPYSLLGAGVVVGLLVALGFQLLTMVVLAVLLWDFRDQPEYGLTVFIFALRFGALPGFFLGFTAGMSQAWLWLRHVRQAGMLSLLGGLIVGVRIILFITRLDGWEEAIGLLLMLFGASLLSALILILRGIYLMIVSISPPTEKDQDTKEPKEPEEPEKPSDGDTPEQPAEPQNPDTPEP